VQLTMIETGFVDLNKKEESLRIKEKHEKIKAVCQQEQEGISVILILSGRFVVILFFKSLSSSLPSVLLLVFSSSSSLLPHGSIRQIERRLG